MEEAVEGLILAAWARREKQKNKDGGRMCITGQRRRRLRNWKRVHAHEQEERV